MTGKDVDDDEYVANLLKQDAQEAGKKYKLVGLDAFRSRPRSEAPKPNTRFLRHIIRETDNHNSALLAREAEEARARLKRMNKGHGVKATERGRLTPPDLTDDDGNPRKRKRHHSDEKYERRRERHHEGHEKLRSTRDKHSHNERRRDRKCHESSDESASQGRSRHSRHTRDHERISKSKHTRRDRDQSSSRKEDTRHRHRRRRSSSADSRSPPPQNRRLDRLDRHGANEDESKYRERVSSHNEQHKENRPRSERHRRQRSSSSRSRSPLASKRRHHTSSKRRRESHSRHLDSRRHRASPSPAGKRKDLSTETQLYGSDSDPLEAIVGPLPPPPVAPVRARGRGAHKVNNAGMDARFSSSYNPADDVKLPSDVEDDWGDALESLRDRQSWKQQGAERLKAAGFSDEQVRKWEKGDEKTEDDVRWASRGQGREWDRGKVLDEDGQVKVQADWGRLT